MAPIRGILMIMGAMTLFTLMSAAVKAAAESVPIGEVMFFRSAMSLPIIAVWLWMRGGLALGLATPNWRPHAVRGIAGTCAMGLNFIALSLLPLAEVTAIRFATPVFLVVMAALILGEVFRTVRLVAVALGLVGVTVIVWPRLTLAGFGGAEALGVTFALGSAALAALAQTFIKAMAETERTEAIVFYFSATATATATVLSLLTLPFGWVVPTPTELALLVGTRVIGAAGQLLLTASYRYADAGALAPFTYVSMLSALVFGYVFFDEVPTWPVLGGAGLVIAAGLIIVVRERQLSREATARRKLRAKGMT